MKMSCCNINKTFNWCCCNNSISFKIQSNLYNSIVLDCYCCNLHLSKTLDKLVDHYARVDYPLVNTQITVDSLTNDEKYVIHTGNVLFGPDTEDKHNKKLFDEFRIEMDRIDCLHPVDSIGYKLLNNSFHDIMCCDNFHNQKKFD